MEAPVGTRWREGTTRRRTDKDDFIVRESWVTKGILAIALFGDTAVLNGEREKEANGRLGNDRGKTVTFGPLMMIFVA